MRLNARITRLGFFIALGSLVSMSLVSAEGCGDDSVTNNTDDASFDGTGTGDDSPGPVGAVEVGPGRRGVPDAQGLVELPAARRRGEREQRQE